MPRRVLVACLLVGCPARGPATYADYGYAVDVADTRSADEAASKRRFDEAARAFRRREYGLAARGFLAAADLLQGPDETPNGHLRRKNRLVCYQNAELAFRQAGDGQTGRDALLAAADRDPDHAEALRVLAAGLVDR